ncbi:hypothetical protein MPSEU_000658300 [Mayamaea pseudoterrestris]|nr:hypothetical protein MPSEU_000658300 [Mayamaea pseudoterrestris]
MVLALSPTIRKQRPSFSDHQQHHSRQQHASVSPSSRLSIFTSRQLVFLSLVVIAMVCNVSLIHHIDRVAANGDTNRFASAQQQQPDKAALAPQVAQLQESLNNLQRQHEQMKESLQLLQSEKQTLLRQRGDRELLAVRDTTDEQRNDGNDKAMEQQNSAALLQDDEHESNNLRLAQQQVTNKSRRSIEADAKVSSFALALNHSTPLPDAVPLDYTDLPNPATNSMKSSVDYHACCGLGHRLGRLSDANYVAQRLNLGLRSFWGFCGDLEVFYYLFGPQREHTLANVTDTGNYLRISNNVKKMNPLTRWPSDETNGCDNRHCGFDKAAMDVAFYKDLMERFRFSPHVEKFRELYFRDKTVIGVHIRAGNGEGGDFVFKGRAIQNEAIWVDNLVLQVKNMAVSSENPVLFVATDTERMIDMLRERLVNVMDVLHVQQRRPEEGRGIMFGEKTAVLNEGEECLHGWEMSLVDMILLSHADAVIVGRPSSFTQTMPMSMQFARPKSERKIAKPYCELDPEATEMRCYDTYSDWCCKGKTAFYMTQKKKEEYIHVPKVPFDLDEHRSGIHPRTSDRAKCLGQHPGARQYCIPYHWGSYQVLANRTAIQLTDGSLVQQALE